MEVYIIDNSKRYRQNTESRRPCIKHRIINIFPIQKQIPRIHIPHKIAIVLKTKQSIDYHDSPKQKAQQFDIFRIKSYGGQK